MSGICGTDHHRGAMIDGSRGFQPTVTVGRYSFRRGATVDGVASRGVTRGFKRRSATRYIVCDGFRGLKPTATIMRSRRDEEVDSVRGATNDGSREFQRPDHGVSYFPCRSATTDGSRGFQPTVTVETFSFRRGATVDGVTSCGVAHGFMRRSATRFIVGAAICGLKPTATIMRSLRDEEAMPMADDERAMRIQKNLEGLGV